MIFPIGDDNPVERFPYVNVGIIAANVLIFFALAFRRDYPSYVDMYGLVPELLRPHSLITHMFLHGGFGHLFGNMLFLGIVGKNVEDRLGHVPYAIVFLLAGFVASGLHIAITRVAGGSDIPMIGASGAVAGIMAAYAAFFPRNQIKFFYWIWILWYGTFFIASAWAIGFWFFLQLAMALLSYHAVAVMGVTDWVPVAYWAHVGGFGAGFVVAVVYNRIVPRNELERSIALFLAQEKPDRAFDRYQRFRKKFPWRTLSPLIQHAVAEAYEESDDVPGAIEAYELFLKTYPENAQAVATREKVASLRGAPLPAPTYAPQHDEEVEESSAHVAAPDFAPVKPEILDPLERAMSLGRQCFRERNWDGAVEQFKKAIASKADSAEAHAYLGVASYQKGVYNEAIQELQNAIELGAQTPVAYNNLALAYFANGQKQEAADAWRHALSIDPRNRTARDRLKQLRI
jgi:membrane associated rhomboid family serine protease